MAELLIVVQNTVKDGRDNGLQLAGEGHIAKAQRGIFNAEHCDSMQQKMQPHATQGNIAAHCRDVWH